MPNTTPDWLIGEAEPGDAILHHPRTVHGSPGNATANFRRAIASIYTGDKVTWNPHPANMFNNKSLTGRVEVPDLVAGGPVDCPLSARLARGRNGVTIATGRRGETEVLLHAADARVVKGALDPEPVNFLAEGEAHH